MAKNCSNWKVQHIYATYTIVADYDPYLKILDKGAFDLVLLAAQSFGYNKTIVHLDTTSEENLPIELVIVADREVDKSEVQKIADFTTSQIWQ